MEIKTIDAVAFQKMFLAGAKGLAAEKDYINELNVFPVPDGDTGTNMTMTIMSAAKEVAALENPDMKTLAKAISSGSLRGARGNSGVILSQLLRGFGKVIKTEEELNVDIICEAMQKAVETAYKAVMKPKEGTILTVARGAADKALEIVDTTDDLVYFATEVVKEAEAVLNKTPDMLPVLKQAGVVDSGGQGLLEVLKGGLLILNGEEVDLTFEDDVKEAPASDVDTTKQYTYEMHFTVCTNESVTTKEKAGFTSFIEKIGESDLEGGASSDIVIKVYTNEPGEVLNKALTLGTLHDVTIKNTKEEAKISESAKEAAPAEPAKDMGFVAVSIGEGMNEIFRELGADYIIEGGQTMNPSAGDILEAVEKVNAKTVFILPNNKNIVLAANQAVDMCEDKRLVVIPTKTIPQGITALVNFIPENSVEDNEKQMTEELANVKTGQVTYAVRNTVIDDKEISEGDYMGIGDAGIVAVNKNREKAFMEMLKVLVDDESGIVSIYYGEEVTEDEANKLGAKVQKKFPNVEVEVACGGQPVYYYVCSVE